MLEVFFDNEKVFSVFEQILKTGSQEVCVPRILYDLGISASDGAEILQSFVFLGIIEETERTDEEGIFRFNPKSPIVLGLCLFDDIVGKYSFIKMGELANDKDSHNELSSSLEDLERVDKMNMDLDDFFNFVKDL